MNLAPTTSTTVMLAMGDALALALLEMKGFKEKDFAFYHPGGNLGKKLLVVSDIMRKGEANPVVKDTTPLRKVLYAITKARAGSATVVNAKNQLVGIFTDGDLRRCAEEGKLLLQLPVRDFMTKNPVSITKDRLAAEAHEILRSKKIDELPVIDEKRRPVGLLDVQDLLKAGIV
jgi:arabinose-5-phosphate isomerase